MQEKRISTLKAPMKPLEKGFTFCMVILLLVLGLACNDDMVNNPVMETGIVSDIDGNTYQTIKIGNQWWMSEDLRVTAFRSGEEISQLQDKEMWQSTDQPAYAIYNNSSSAPGLLYNFYTVDNDQEIAPEGWRVPTDEDWKVLEEYLGMSVVELDQTNWRGVDEGDQLKEMTTNTSGWILYDGVWGTNSTGFTALGNSCRVFEGSWGVPGLRHTGFWWSSTENDGYGWYRYLDYKKSGIFRYSAHPNYGFSIRCIKE